MTTTDPFTEAARAEAGRRYAPEARLPVMKPSDRMDDLPRRCAIDGFTTGAEWARAHLAAQEESVLMTSREETISDRLSDAGYTEYAEDEDGGVTWVSAPLGEVLRIVSAAQEPTDAEARIAAALKIHSALDAVDERVGARRKVCAGCGTDSGNWQVWPCPTVRALAEGGEVR